MHSYNQHHKVRMILGNLSEQGCEPKLQVIITTPWPRV